MRALIAAAVAVLSVTGAYAQEMKPAAVPAASESAERALPPAVATPTLIEQLKAVGELKEPKASETKPLEAPKVEASEIKTAEAEPVETKAVEAPPVAAKPVDAKPLEAAKPAETKAVAAKASESKPVQASETKPAKRKVVRKRETDEQKARRIAAKYGISW